MIPFSVSGPIAVFLHGSRSADPRSAYWRLYGQRGVVHRIGCYADTPVGWSIVLEMSDYEFRAGYVERVVGRVGLLVRIIRTGSSIVLDTTTTTYVRFYGRTARAIVQAMAFDDIDVVSTCMASEPDDRMVTEIGCIALTSIARASTPQPGQHNLKTVRRVAPLLFRSMVHHESSPNVQRWGCAAIEELTWKSDSGGRERARELVQQHAMDHVLRALRKYMDNLELAWRGVMALINLTWNSHKFKLMFLHALGIPTLLSMIRVTTKNTTSTRRVSKLQGAICRLIGNLARVEECSRAVVQANGLVDIVDVLTRFQYDRNVQRYAVEAIKCVVWNIPDHVDAARSAGVIPLLRHGVSIRIAGAAEQLIRMGERVESVESVGSAGSVIEV